MIRCIAALSVCTVAASAGIGSVGDRRTAPVDVRPPPRSSYMAPVDGAVVVLRPFEPPPGPYAAGHRGVDLATRLGAVVRASQAGRVRFSGQVGGRGVVVVDHSDGIRTEYEPVTPSVAVGALVGRGQALGSMSGRHGGCAPGGCLHWGAQQAGHYFDPMTLLAPLGVVRLVPWSDTAS